MVEGTKLMQLMPVSIYYTLGSKSVCVSLRLSLIYAFAIKMRGKLWALGVLRLMNSKDLRGMLGAHCRDQYNSSMWPLSDIPYQLHPIL